MAIYKTLVKKISIPPEMKTKQKDYLAQGNLAIIDQGQPLIGGYSNSIKMQIRCNLPVIVFGDHTRAVKYINFPFGAGADGIKILEPKKDVTAKYLYYGTHYLTLTLPDKGYARHYQYLEKEDLYLPPIPEQERIVAHIEELFSELDAGVETLKKTKAQLDVYRQAVLKEAFENQDTCSSHSLSELMLTVKNGYGIKPDDEGQYKILKISAVRAANLDLDEYRYNKMPFDNNYLIHENDLLFTRYNGSRELVGVCAAVPRLKTTYAYPDKIIKCTPKLQNTFHSKYIQYYLSQGEPRKYIRSKTKTTSGQHGISGSDLKKARIYLPSIAEQEDIVRKIESRLSVCNNIEQTIDATLEQAKALRHSILKEAFEGSLAQ